MPEAVLYGRVSPKGTESRKSAKRRAQSSASQTKDTALTSTKLQLDMLRKYADMLEYTVIAEFEDVYKSGKNADRAELQKAIKFCKERKAALFIYDLSRLTRGSLLESFKIAEDLDKAECSLISPKENMDRTTATGRLLMDMLIRFNQYQREITAEKVSAAMLYYQDEERLSMGGQAPFGWRIIRGAGEESPRLVLDETEQEVILRVVTWYVKGMGMRAVCRALTGAGYMPRAGAWRHGLVRSILEGQGIDVREKKRRPRRAVTPTGGEIFQPE